LFFSSLLQKADESHIHSAHHQFFNPKKKGGKKEKKKKEKKMGVRERERERSSSLGRKKFSAVAQRQTTFTQFVAKNHLGCTHTHTHIDIHTTLCAV